MSPGTDVALVSLGTTPGLRRADEALAAAIREGGATCEVLRVRIGWAGRLRRQIAVTDAVEALAARRAARGIEAGVVVYSTVTAALLQRPAGAYAVRFDAPAALNRPGLSGAWQRARERRVLSRARVLLPWGEAAARAAASALTGARPPILTLPVPVDPPAPAPVRDIAAAAYAGYPRKRGLDLLCAAWAAARPADGRLVVGGLDREKGVAWLRRCGVPEPPGVDWAGALPRDRWLETVARARLFVNASRWEDHGLAQLEALAAGAALVTVPSPGVYEALPIARSLAPALVAREVSAAALADALRAGLELDDEALEGYAARARPALVRFSPEAVRRVLVEQVLPALGIGGAPRPELAAR